MHVIMMGNKANGRKKPEGTTYPIGNFQIWKHILSISASMLLALCSRISSTWSSRVLHLHYPTSEDIHFVLWICNRNEITNAIELQSLKKIILNMKLQHSSSILNIHSLKERQILCYLALYLPLSQKKN